MLNSIYPVEVPDNGWAAGLDPIISALRQRGVAVARELTKIYETVWRGTLDAATTHVGSTAPRGEYVIVIEGAPARGAISDDEIRSALHAALDGHTRKDAVAAVVGQLEVPKRRVYDLALAVNRDD